MSVSKETALALYDLRAVWNWEDEQNEQPSVSQLVNRWPRTSPHLPHPAVLCVIQCSPRLLEEGFGSSCRRRRGGSDLRKVVRSRRWCPRRLSCRLALRF